MTPTRIPKAVLKLLDQMAAPETPADHIRNGIQLLIEADDRVQGLTIPPDETLTDLIRAAEARMFRALVELSKEES